MKKTITFALVISLCLTLAVSASAADAAASGSFGESITWELKNNILTISGSGDMPACGAAEEVPWDAYRYHVFSVVISDGVTGVCDYAFSGCANLCNISMSDSVAGLGSMAFSDCAGLKAVRLPDNVASIGDYLFMNCSSLQYVAIGENTTELSVGTFYNCGALRDLYMPKGITYVPDMAFYECVSFENLYYSGDLYDWSAVRYGESNNFFCTQMRLNLECTPADLPVAPGPAAAVERTQTVEIDGEPVELSAYALVDAAGGVSNYVRLREIAYLLNGTEAQFSVGWDNQVIIITGESYTVVGGEQGSPFSGNRGYSRNDGPTVVDGIEVVIDGISLYDDELSGYTYYKLRDLGAALGFNVGWSAERGIYIESGKPYTAS